VQHGTVQKGMKFPSTIFTRCLIFLLGDKIVSCHSRKKYEVTELGIMNPEEVPAASLRPGQVGYIACNMKESTEGQKVVKILRVMLIFV
jgi:translation elongation factor EF-4